MLITYRGLLVGRIYIEAPVLGLLVPIPVALLPKLKRPCGAVRVVEAEDAWLKLSRD